MKLIDTRDAVGHVLCHDLTQIIPGVTKDARFRKGHVVAPEDIPVLLGMGKEHLYVWEMTPGMLHEDEGAERLLMDAGTIPVSELQRKYADNGNWQFLPRDMAEAVGKAAALLAETGSAQRSDCLLDRACFQKLRQLAEESRCVYLQTYVRAMIDAANLRALVRAERMHMDPGFLQEVLFEGGSVTPDAIRAGASEPAALFRSTALREAAELGEAAVKGGSLTDFEKACDNAVLRTAAGARRVPFGVEVALGYLIAKEAEWTAVRIVMAGRLAGLSADAIRERLRDTYV